MHQDLKWSLCEFMGNLKFIAPEYDVKIPWWKTVDWLLCTVGGEDIGLLDCYPLSTKGPGGACWPTSTNI